MVLSSDPLPLRTTRDLGDYAEAATLPLVYGRVTLRPVRLDRAGRRWLLADHPIVAVERVWLDESPFSGWVLRHDVLGGRAVAVLETTRSPQRTIVVRVIGRPAARGTALRHPADICTDLLDLCGQRSAASDAALDGLRTDLPGLYLSARIDGGTLRAALAGVLDPLGVIWCTTPWVATAAETGEPVTTLDARRCERLEAACRADDLATRLAIDWGYDYAASRPLGSLTLVAEQIAYGSVTRRLAMPYVATARDALAIGTRRLADMARPTWTITATLPWLPEPLAIGATVAVDHPHAPGGLARVMSRELDPGRARHTYRLRLIDGAPPAVRVEHVAAALDDAGGAPPRISYRDGVATITLIDEAGQPISGAAVTLDGDVTAVSDRLGRVQFRTGRGPHSLRVVAYGYEDYDMDITI